jgi:hypothetical protein
MNTPSASRRANVNMMPIILLALTTHWPVQAGQQSLGGFPREPAPTEVVTSRQSDDGTVVAIGKNTVTLRPGPCTITKCAPGPDGRLVTVRKWEYQELPPVEFQLAGLLAEGKYSKMVSHSYPIADVRVGDKVSIQYTRRFGVYHCEMIIIHRRPGGKVPPAPGDDPTSRQRWHEQCNAHQFVEETLFPALPWLLRLPLVR